MALNQTPNSISNGVSTSESKHILVLDGNFGPSLNAGLSFTSFLSASDNTKLLIISSPGALSDQDKENALAYAEVVNPTVNGAVELIALEWHKQYRIDRIYTKQEDLILRAAYLRDLLDIPGLKPKEALAFRDKHYMKTIASQKGFKCPVFQKVYSPSCIIKFIRTHNFPVILKPLMGCAASGITILRTQQDLEEYLHSQFFDRVDDDCKRMDYSGDIIIEKFLEGDNLRMVHVNGYAHQGKLEIVWPFVYLQTNLEFTKGKAYGNVLVSQNEPLYQHLLEATNRLLETLPCPEHLIFHLELFVRGSETQTPEILLCEIAARRPGGSIASLIDAYEGGNSIFHEMEFRLSNGLGLRHVRKVANARVVGDLMIPYQIGVLKSIPTIDDAKRSLGIDAIEYRVVGKVGTKYTGFSVNHFNTAARFIIDTSRLACDEEEDKQVSLDQIVARLRKAQLWFDSHVQYEPLSEVSALERQASSCQQNCPCNISSALKSAQDLQMVFDRIGKIKLLDQASAKTSGGEHLKMSSS